MTLTYEQHLDWIQINQRAGYLCEKDHFIAKLLSRHTYTHTGLIAISDH